MIMCDEIRYELELKRKDKVKLMFLKMRIIGL